MSSSEKKNTPQEEAREEDKERREEDDPWTIHSIRRHLVGEIKVKNAEWTVIAWREDGTHSDIYDVYGRQKKGQRLSTHTMKLYKPDLESISSAKTEMEIYNRDLPKSLHPTRFLKLDLSSVIREIRYNVDMRVDETDITSEEVRDLLTETDKEFPENLMKIPFLVLEKVFFTIAKLRSMAPPARKRGFPEGFALRLGLGCLNAIEAFHAIGLVHRHITPANFGIRLTPDKKFPADVDSAVVLLDFGSAKRWPGDHEPLNTVPFVGSPLYSSVNAHKFMDQGPVDDLWSLFYMLVEWCSDVDLPWSKESSVDAIGTVKEKVKLDELCKPCSKVAGELRDIAGSLENVSAFESPKVESIRKTLEKAAKANILGMHPNWIRFAKE